VGKVNLSWFLQFLIILGFLILGHGVVTVTHLPLPSSVVGMIVLFIFLLTGMLKLEWIEKASTFQLKHLTLLFIPPIVSLFLSLSFQETIRLNVLAILVVSSLCCLLGTAFSVEWYEKIKGRNSK
jgi:holin-like protein